MSGETQTTPAVVKPSGRVKIKTLLPIALGKKGDNVVGAGQIVEVTEDEAKEFADKTFSNVYSFGGERSDATAERHVIRRAERVAVAANG